MPNHNKRLPEFSWQSNSCVPFDGKFLNPSALSEAPNPDMPLIEAICTRRTSRAYAKRLVPDDTFEWLVKYSMHAPTACNEQQWKIININDKAIIHDLYSRGSASFLNKASQCFLICYNRQSDNREWSDHIQSGAAFITTFQLLAHSIGVGSCWIGHLPNKAEMRRVFKINRHYEPVALVSYGYYRSKIKVLPRKHDTEHIVMVNYFDSSVLKLKSDRGTIFRSLARFIYYRTPPFIRKRLRSYTKKYEKKFYYETYD